MRDRVEIMSNVQAVHNAQIEELTTRIRLLSSVNSLLRVIEYVCGATLHHR